MTTMKRNQNQEYRKIYYGNGFQKQHNKYHFHNENRHQYNHTLRHLLQSCNTNQPQTMPQYKHVLKRPQSNNKEQFLHNENSSHNIRKYAKSSVEHNIWNIKWDSDDLFGLRK